MDDRLEASALLAAYLSDVGSLDSGCQALLDARDVAILRYLLGRLLDHGVLAHAWGLGWLEFLSYLFTIERRNYVSVLVGGAILAALLNLSTQILTLVDRVEGPHK